MRRSHALTRRTGRLGRQLSDRDSHGFARCERGRRYRRCWKFRLGRFALLPSFSLLTNRADSVPAGPFYAAQPASTVNQISVASTDNLNSDHWQHHLADQRLPR